MLRAEKGGLMTTGETAAPGNGKTGPLPFDTSKPHQARVYDYLLGGKDNYAADRDAAEALLAVYPGADYTARANRAFLGRAVCYLTAEAGIRQFLDIGTGIPTAGNTHEVAQAIAPETRVVYADYDPIVLAHARALLDSHEAGATEYIEADLRDTDKILTRAADLLDFTKPVAITMLAILHAIPDTDNPHAIVTKLLDAVPPGSYLAISHAASDLLDQETMHSFADSWNSRGQQRITWRTRDQVARFFADTDLVEPGLVRVDEWHPAPGTINAGKSNEWGAVGRKLGIR
jgi:S-adenosyl methyltransferase